jgi:heterodisulfide reductase subunit C
VILAVIMLSGVLLEGAKIVSHTRYKQMVEDYLVAGDEKELKALEAYWVRDFGVVSPDVKGPLDAETLRLGAEVHENSCRGCHSRPQWAFLGYGASRILSPVALGMDRAGVPSLLWYIHFLACWVGLAYLPFSKMFHILASPLSLLAGAVMTRERSNPANIATRQILELDACTHCCTCTLHCSAGAFFEYLPNTDIFPSEKLISVKALATGREMSEQDLRHIQEGVYLCTNCRRCTVVCPVGINLQDLWFDVREMLLERGYPELSVLSPFSFYRGLMRSDLLEEKYRLPLDQARKAIEERCEGMRVKDKVLTLSGAGDGFKTGLSRSTQANSFAGCFGCETCTTVCPVVAAYENPQEALGLLPHQIMHSCGLGLRDLALGSAMLWYCLTCYRCQEMCPQKVCVTDVLYELKNRAVKQGKERPWQQTESV